MLTKHSLETMSVVFVAAVLIVGGLISFPATQTAEAAINIGQQRSQTNACGFLFVPVVCNNIGDNPYIVTPTPV